MYQILTGTVIRFCYRKLARRGVVMVKGVGPVEIYASHACCRLAEGETPRRYDSDEEAVMPRRGGKVPLPAFPR